MTEALINPQILQWASSRCNLSASDLAKNVEVKQEKVISWLEGRSYPSFSKAKKLARILRIPFGYLYLTNPPVENIPLPDLRTIENNTNNKFSLDFIETLRATRQKQQWFKDFLISEGEESLPFVSKYSPGTDENIVARDIRKELEIDEKIRKKSRTWSDFLANFIKTCEDKRIVILKNSVVNNSNNRKLSLDEFRGFLIVDKIAPFIFINGTDTKAGQIFTLAHELAHLWIGKEGISNPDLRISQQKIIGIEQYCNRIAAEILVPESDFNKYWDRAKSVHTNLEILARQFKVSQLVILRRAYDLNKVNHARFNHYYSEILKFIKSRENILTSGNTGNFYNTLLSRNSRLLSHTLISATLEGKVTFRDAAKMLNVKWETLEKAAIELNIRG